MLIVMMLFFCAHFYPTSFRLLLWLFHLTWCCCFLKGNNLLPGFRQPVVADCLLQKVMKHCRSWAAYLTINKSLSDVAVAVLPKTPQLIIRRCMFATYKNIIIQTLSLLSVCYRIDCHSWTRSVPGLRLRYQTVRFSATTIFMWINTIATSWRDYDCNMCGGWLVLNVKTLMPVNRN